MQGDYIDIIEAAYLIDCSEETWLDGLLRAIRKAIEPGGGAWAMLYKVSAAGRVSIDRIQFEGARSGEVAGWVTRQLVRSRGAESGLFQPTPCGLASENRVAGHPPRTSIGPGAGDVLGVNGADPSGRGVFIGVEVPLGIRLSPDDRIAWSRIGVHVAAARRLRSRVAGEGRVEARLHPDGRLEHVEAAASSIESRRQLRRAVRAMDRSRGALRRKSPASAVAEWRGLVDARWTLVDEFQENGRRYVVARENRSAAPDFERLTERELQVVGFASLGHSNKLIAYELGIATSTVGVLVSRAMGKLGLSTRKALLAAFIERGRRTRGT